MFLTWVARRRNSRPSALVQSIARRGHPRRLEIAGGKRFYLRRAGRVPDVPERVDAVVLGERLGERIGFAGDDVDDAGRDVRRIEDRVEVGRAQGMGGRRDRDDAIAHGDRRHDERDESEKRRFVRADDSHHAPRLVHRERHEARARRVNRAVELVGVSQHRRTRGGPKPRPRPRPRERRRRSLRAGASRTRLRGRSGSRRHNRALARDCAPSPRPRTQPWPPPRRRCGHPCGCRGRQAPTSRPAGSRTA